MAFIVKPKILILDEPTLGLDVKVRRDLWRLIREFAENYNSTVLLTTHYLEEAEHLASRIGIMKSGELVALGYAKEIIKTTGAQNFEDAFLSLAGSSGEEDE